MSAKQNFFLPHPRGPLVFCQLLGFAFLLLPSLSRAQSLDDAAHELAMKVCLGPHKQPVRVGWQDSNQSSGYLTDARRKIFLDQISACGLAAPENSDVPLLTVAMQVTASRALLLADWTDTSGGRQTFMVEAPRPSMFIARDTAHDPQLQRELLWQQGKPIESALEWQDLGTQERYLFLLTDGQFVRCRLENGVWRLLDSAELPANWQRSRGGENSVVYSQIKGSITLALQKKTCEVNLSGRVTFTCAGNERSEKSRELLSTCEADPRVLSSGKGDYTQLDRVSLRRSIDARTEILLEDSDSSSVDMPGPVLDMSVAENKRSASAVVRNLSSGNYEVYRITAVCGN